MVYFGSQSKDMVHLEGKLCSKYIRKLSSSIGSHDAERDEHWCLVHFILCIQCWATDNGIVLSAFKVGLHSSVKPFWE